MKLYSLSRHEEFPERKVPVRNMVSIILITAVLLASSILMFVGCAVILLYMFRMAF